VQSAIRAGASDPFGTTTAHRRLQRLYLGIMAPGQQMAARLDQVGLAEPAQLA